MISPTRIAAALAAALLLTATALAADPTGTWKWSMPGRNGQAMERTLHLELKDGQLTGTVDGRMGSAAIRDAQFKDDEVAFNVTIERGGNTFTSKYRGKVSGDTITGTIELPAWGRGGPRAPEGAENAPGGNRPGESGGGPRQVEWQAKRA